MSYSQLRINKTKDLTWMLDELQKRYKLLSEPDIVKLALCELYWRKCKQEEDTAEDQDGKAPHGNRAIC